ncbi:hypothetical protein KEM54_005445 [Ascosphaera aggregata]|nr:hypothetical protein KEM54_005445 [Ascosphaera aggregata]
MASRTDLKSKGEYFEAFVTSDWCSMVNHVFLLARLLISESTTEDELASSCHEPREDIDRSSGFDSTQESGAMQAALAELQAALQSNEKKDTFLRGFEKQISIEERKVLKAVQDDTKKRETEITTYRQTFTSLLLASMSPTGGGEFTDEMELFDASPKAHPLHKKYSSLTSACESLDAMLREINDGHNIISPAEIPPDLKDVFCKDFEALRRVIGVGMKASQLDIESVMTAKREKNEKNKRLLQDDENLVEMVKLGESTSDLGVKQHDMIGWGRTAKRVKKGVKTLVQVLPDYEPVAGLKKK